MPRDNNPAQNMPAFKVSASRLQLIKLVSNCKYLKVTLSMVMIFLMVISCKKKTTTEDQAFSEENIEVIPYDGSWEALQQMPIPAWFDDGKIGLFIHWGPYSVIGYRKDGRGYAEHVPKLLYSDSLLYYPYMQERWGATPPEFGYKDIIPEFKAEKWNPDEWATLFAEVGVKYVVLTAEHHDGFSILIHGIPWTWVPIGI
jgi:alpha-L-fucosidase